MKIKLKRFSAPEGNPSNDESWGWIAHCLTEGGKELIIYPSDPIESKEEAKEDLDRFLNDYSKVNEVNKDNNIKKVLHRKVTKLDGTDHVSEWKEKYPKAEVEEIL